MLQVSIHFDSTFDIDRPGMHEGRYRGTISAGGVCLHEFEGQGAGEEAQACAAYWICRNILNREDPALADRVRQLLAERELVAA